MAEVMSGQSKKIHPYKFTLWVAIGSITMMFAGLTSAYIVKRNQANWAMLEMPVIFWYSTVAIILSSVTVQMAVKAFKERKLGRYRTLVSLTAALGTLFLILQVIGFTQFGKHDIRLVGAGSNPSYSFLLAIAGLHGLHVLGGVIALLVIFGKAVSSKYRSYSSIPIEVAATYWHFVGILWIYLVLFFNWLK
jgi:cytochrome c oxidase subunit III